MTLALLLYLKRVIWDSYFIPTILTALLITFPFKAAAQKFDTHVTCDSGMWKGISIHKRERDFKIQEDRIDYSDVHYIINAEHGAPSFMITKDKYWIINIQNEYRSYVVGTYVYGGVAYTDTVFKNGLVFSQYSKESFFGPMAGAFYIKNKHLVIGEAAGLADGEGRTLLRQLLTE